MIKSFSHRGLARYFMHSDHRGIPAHLAPRLRRMLDRLDAAVRVDDMNVPGYRFHMLKGDRKQTYSARVSGNWRLTFNFADGHATHVDLEDYH